MNLGAIRQFEGLKNRRFFPPHETQTFCYCHRCFADFMVTNVVLEHERVDDTVMHYLHVLGMPDEP